MQACPKCNVAIQVPEHLPGLAVICPACGERFKTGNDNFDAYYTWLGIPPSEQPPHFYRLLGIQVFESNPRVIEHAADRQMTYLRSLKIGVHAAHSERLLGEVSTARMRLLDPYFKVAYDSSLRGQAAVAVQDAAIALDRADLTTRESTPPPRSNYPDSAGSISVGFSRPAAKRGRQHRTSSGFATVDLIVLGGLIGLGIGGLIAERITGRDLIGLDAWLRNLRKDDLAAQNRKHDEGKRTRETRLPSPPPRIPRPPGKKPTLEPPSPEGEPPPMPEPAPTPSAPPAAPIDPARRLNPFVNGRASCDLPGPTTQEFNTFFEFATPPAALASFALHSPTANVAAPARILCKASAQGNVWDVFWARDANLLASAIQLGAIRLDGSMLSFAWTEKGAAWVNHGELGNCLLEMNEGGESRWIQLRKPQIGSPMLLNMDEKRRDVEFAASDCPAKEKLFLEITELRNFPPGARLRGDANFVSFNKPAVIEFPDLKEAEIELRLLQQPTTRNLLVRIEPIVKRRGNEFELTRPRLKKLIAALQQELNDLQSRINNLPSQITSAESNVASIRGLPPPATPAELGSRNRQLAAALAVVGGLRNEMVQTERQITTLQARLESATELLSLAEELHHRASIAFTVGAVRGQYQLNLVEAHGEPSRMPVDVAF